jgi:4-amino-4-deoxy-L-arabinose transferase-like glycosyltransferase
VILAAAVAVELSAMRLGPALHADSAAYIAGARNLVEGMGFSRPSGPTGVKPITVHAPGFSLALAGLQLLGLEAIAGARILNALLFGLNCVMVGVATRQVTSSPWAGVLGSLLMLTSPTMIEVHSWALSEPTYIFLGLVGLWLLSVALASGRMGTLVVSAGALGLALLTRYVGGTLVATGGLMILVSAGRSWRWRLTRLGAFTAVSALPIAIALLRNWLVAGTLTNRRFSLHPISLSLLKRPFGVAWNWVLPLHFGYAALVFTVLLFAAVLVAVAVYLWRRERRRKALETFTRGALTSILGLYIVVYGAALLISLSFFDAAIPIDDRTMSPVYGPLLILLVGGGWGFLRSPRRARLRPLGSLLVISLLMSFGFRSAGLLRSLSTEPRGFGALAAQQGGGLPEIEAIPTATTIYTNNLEALYFIYGRGGFLVPEPLDPMTLETRSDYAPALERVLGNVDAGAVVVMFSASSDELDPLLEAGLTVSLESGGVIILSR